ncbi:MAG: hydrogenase maturation nickel metallochaperone HypA [Candidatus Methanoperedens sp.]|nr:hydrogenase maturation nickel metallochaperone HypA [Candidatus Methanoperedens sp.]MCE8426964.1 hydrogenase maturation nickel metallochaperone HypA [Candidatus Methanoperedens sp.]
MHEISIAGAIFDAVIDAAGKNNATRVKEIFIEIGELTALNPGQLKFIFETISKGTVAEDAKYDIKVIKPLINCRKCSYNGQIEFFERLHFFLPVIKCPQCGDIDVVLKEGRECCVKKIRID